MGVFPPSLPLSFIFDDNDDGVSRRYRPWKYFFPLSPLVPEEETADQALAVVMFPVRSDLLQQSRNMHVKIVEDDFVTRMNGRSIVMTSDDL